MCAVIREELPLAMFPNGHGCTGIGKGTFSDVGGEAVVNTDRSFLIETNGAEEASVAASPELDPIDLNGKHVVFHSELGFAARLKTIKLRLASGNIATDFVEATVWKGEDDPIILHSTFERQSLPLEVFAVTGSVNWSAITHAQILVTDNKTGKLACTWRASTPSRIRDRRQSPSPSAIRSKAPTPSAARRSRNTASQRRST